ncbi:DNA mismatch repair endonuclease MutL [Psychromonas sp. psych-6C06]|uniref:DNA mismatch repair endonuclease MutL n=1 Tax=Psychromonas sp. psych-6C06 TaxID=2058089 RepID=UPI000C31CD5A|nr:DNA mismatch repair endonuclease MutL [Psychromonas sp. psych-6C06]PKF61189.1 DNA mismatch repair endonuclease MutL [Psychromonas sp. psych-6C06]
MAIEILPARLANQIAAGEVVERPASVVKELIENSLDAGATRIEIDIEKGGAKCIRIKDNGVGVCKDQLTLALSRHATSKISHLDDLEAIVSLGFRGEALASISSVSRLTFTSKPSDQDQAWQAVAEGRDMQVNIQPAAHPQGTTVEVLDLFFNTPARRRFLKTEKTEFQHIDELIRRIALSSFDIGFVLRHNGKIIRQYRAAQTSAQIDKRLASICSESFVKSALSFSSEENSNTANYLKISGWISDRLSPRLLGDVQYCYINGRMIRDKLVNHAIKQAYARLLPEGQFPGYVIYIHCPAEQVDVNVHPSKHEVRFHQARWVHDYIVSTLSMTLNSEDAHQSHQQYEHDYQPPQSPLSSNRESSAGVKSNNYSEPRNQSGEQGNAQPHYQTLYKPTPLDERQVNAYCDFVSESHQPLNGTVDNQSQSDFELLSLVDNRHALVKVKSLNELLLVSLPRCYQYVEKHSLLEAWQNGEVISQPLLLPVRIILNDASLQISERFESLFLRLGFSFKNQTNKLIISKVPALLRQAPIGKILPLLFDYLSTIDAPLSDTQIDAFCDFMIQQISTDKSFDVSAVTALLSRFSTSELMAQNALYIRPDLTLLLQGFSDE